VAYYIIKYGERYYANAELYTDAVAGGERSFMKMLARGEAEGKEIFDTVVYRLTGEERSRCEACEGVEAQDFDGAYRGIHRLPRPFMEKYKKGEAAYMPKARLITVSRSALAMVEKTYRHKHCVFFKIRDLAYGKKYEMLPKMAAIKVCGSWYVALDSVNQGVNDPVIVSA
jgi:hypothetical protein